MDKFLILLIALALQILLGLLISYPIMLLWNYCLVPAVSVTAEIGWMQAWGILSLIMLATKTDISFKA